MLSMLSTRCSKLQVSLSTLAKYNHRYNFWSGTFLGLCVGVLSSVGMASADPWDDWDESDSEVAPMIESYHNLQNRAQDAFNELEEEFGERPRKSRVLKRRAKRIQRRRIRREVRRELDRRAAEVAERRAAEAAERRAAEAAEAAERRFTQRRIARRRALERQERANTRNRKRLQRGTPDHRDFEVRVLKLVNQERAHGGQCGHRSYPPSAPLRGNRNLTQAAHRHGVAMARDNFFDHRGPRGDTPRSRINDSGYRGRAWGENIAAGQRSPESVVRAWMKSPGHCSNILNPLFSELGVSFVFEPQSHYKTYWVQAFGTPSR